jgi:hypothetical protein
MTNHTNCLHPATKAARAACRRAAARRVALMPHIDAAHDAVLVANMNIVRNDASTFAEYDRAERVLKGLLIAFTDGDVDYAESLRNMFADSGEDIEYYTTNWTRDEAVDSY